MSATFNAANGQVSVIGTDNPDTIVFTKSATKLYVTENGTSVHAFDLAKVKKIYADGKLGRDTITVDVSITIPAQLHGGGCTQFGSLTGNVWEVDRLQGGGGKDTLFADQSPCEMNGGGGDDTIYFNGNCFVKGDAGNDKIVRTPGYSGYAEAYGGPGTDTFSVEMFNVGQIIGNDSVLRDEINEDAEHYRLNGGDTYPEEFENFTGGSGNDTIFGTDSANTIHGGAGNDVIRAKGGNDIVYGEKGNDYIVGGAGYDQMFGGDDSDEIDSADGYTHDLVDGGAGYDKAHVDIFDLPSTSVEKFI